MERRIVARESALGSQLAQREERGVWVSCLYLAGLVLAPIAALACVVQTAGNLVGAPLIALLIAALTQKRTSAPSMEAEDDGMVPLPELEGPLESTLERLAGRLGAPMPEVVYLAPEGFAAAWIANFKVDWGGWSLTWTPALVLGALPMRALGRDAFEAILAHELAHLTRRPSLKHGLFAIAQMAAEACLARSRASFFQRWFNPACWWTHAWYRALDRTVVSARRLEELVADEIAVRAVGADTLKRALDTYLLTLAQVRALAEAQLHAPADFRVALHAYFEHGPARLPPASDPAVSGRLRHLLAHRATSHPTPSARHFMAEHVQNPGETLPDASDAGTLYLLPKAGRAYLPALLRYLVNARRALAGRFLESASPWAVCHDQRARLSKPNTDGWLPRWQFGPDGLVQQN